MTDEGEIEQKYGLKDFVAELRRLADAIEAGEEFSMDIDGQDIVVPVGAAVSVEFEQEDGIAEIEFQLSWEIDEDDEDDESDEDDSGEDAEMESEDA